MSKSRFVITLEVDGALASWLQEQVQREKTRRGSKKYGAGTFVRELLNEHFLRQQADAI